MNDKYSTCNICECLIPYNDTLDPIKSLCTNCYNTMHPITQYKKEASHKGFKSNDIIPTRMKKLTCRDYIVTTDKVWTKKKRDAWQIRSDESNKRLNEKYGNGIVR